MELQKDRLDAAQMCEVQTLCFHKITHVWRPAHFLLTYVLAILLPLWWHQLSPRKLAQVAPMKARKCGIRGCELPESGKRGGEPSPARREELPSEKSGWHHPEFLLCGELGARRPGSWNAISEWAEAAHEVGPPNTTRTPALIGHPKGLHQNLN